VEQAADPGEFRAANWSRLIQRESAAYLVAATLILVQLILNRPFWEDEASLALAISMHGLLDLLHPLDFNQVAPVGFALLEKISTLIFGDRDWAYRIIPALASLFLLYQIRRLPIEPSKRVFFLFLLFLNTFFLRYTVEAKPYIIDALLSIVLLRLLLEKRYSEMPPVLAVAVWFSSVAFVAVVPVSLVLLNHRREPVIRWSRVVICAASLGFYYVAFVRANTNRAYMVSYWNFAGGLYVPGQNYFEFLWKSFVISAEAVRPVYDLCYAVGFAWMCTAAVIALLALGMRTETGRFAGAFLATHIALGSLQLYPVDERLMLDIVPLICALLVFLNLNLATRGGILALSLVSALRKPVYPFVTDDTRAYLAQISAAGYPGVFTAGGTTAIAQYYVRSLRYPLRVMQVRTAGEVADPGLPLLIVNYRYNDFDPKFLERYRRRDTIRTVFGTSQQSRSGLFIPPRSPP
jgi:hypothetical protein